MRIVKYSHGEQPFTDDAHRVRDEVFVREQQVDPSEEYEFEEDSTHYILYDHQQPIATGRWRRTEGGIKLERFAVLKSHRNLGLGGRVLNRILDDLAGESQMLYLHAQLPAVSFYQRHGFVAVGEEFVEADIRHLKMVKNP